MFVVVVYQPLLGPAVARDNLAIMGIVFIQSITMLGIWQTTLDFVRGVTGLTSYPVIFTAAFAIAMAAPAGLLALASAVAASRNGESIWRNIARFGYALIPLDVAGHIAHNLFHPARRRQVRCVHRAGHSWELRTRRVDRAGVDGRDRDPAVPDPEPYLILLTGFGAIDVVLFALPMSMRM